MSDKNQRPSLAASFGAPATAKTGERDRAAGLQGLLPTRSPRPTEPESDSSEGADRPTAPPAVPEPTKAAAQPRTPTPATRAAPQSVSVDTGKVNTRAVYVPPDTLASVRKASRERDLTYTDLLVEAFEEVSDDRLRAEFQPEEKAATAMPTRPSTPRGREGIQMNLRLDGAQERWLDGKKAQVGAPSRSALVATVFRLQFQGERVRGR